MKNYIWIFCLVGLLCFGVGRWSASDNAKVTKNQINNSNDERVVREISSEGMDQDQLIKVINEKIVAIRSKNQVHSSIREIIALAKSHPEMPMVNIYANALKPLRQLKGIVWRLRGIVEKCGACHIMGLNLIKGLYYKDYMLGPHLLAILDYLIEPNTFRPKFKSVGQLQNWIKKYLIPDLAKSLSNIYAITKKLPEDFEFEFDNYLLTGYDKEKNIRFMSEKTEKRYKKVVRGNLYFIMAQKSRFLSMLYFAINYNFDKLMPYFNKIVRKTALNNFFGTLPKHSTPIEFLDILSKFKSLGKARTKKYSKHQIQKHLDLSLTYLYNTQAYQVKALVESVQQSNLSDSDSYLINPKLLSVNYDDILENMQERAAIFKLAKEENIAYSVTSKATAMQFQINPGALFKFQKDLKFFLP